MPLALAVAGLALVGEPATARRLLSREAALAQIFGPTARVTTHTVFLTPGQAAAAERAAASKLASPRVVRYRVTAGDSLLGTAYLDTHPVRTLNETVLIAVRPDGRVRAVEILTWNEPDDYRAPARWLDRFEGESLSKELRPGERLPHLAGATLTARALAAAVRRTLAVHAAIGEEDAR